MAYEEYEEEQDCYPQEELLDIEITSNIYDFEKLVGNNDSIYDFRKNRINLR